MPRRELTVTNGEFVLANPRDARDIYTTKASLNVLFDIQRGDNITMRVSGFWSDIDNDDVIKVPKGGFPVRNHNASRLEIMDPATGEAFTVIPTDDLQATVIYTLRHHTPPE